MNKVILLLVTIAVIGVGVFLFRKYQKVKPTDKGFYVDVNGKTDFTRDANGNYLKGFSPQELSKNSSDTKLIKKSVLTPLSFSSSQKLVEGLAFSSDLT